MIRKRKSLLLLVLQLLAPNLGSFGLACQFRAYDPAWCSFAVSGPNNMLFFLFCILLSLLLFVFIDWLVVICQLMCMVVFVFPTNYPSFWLVTLLDCQHPSRLLPDHHKHPEESLRDEHQKSPQQIEHLSEYICNIYQSVESMNKQAPKFMIICLW